MLGVLVCLLLKLTEPFVCRSAFLLLQFMTIASIGARMRVKRVRMVLVVAPVSVLGGWQEEGKKERMCSQPPFKARDHLQIPQN